MFTKLFWKDLAERLIATLAQVAVGLFSASGVTSVNAEVYVTTLLVAGALVVLKALAATRVTDSVSPASLAPAAPDVPAIPEQEV